MRVLFLFVGIYISLSVFFKVSAQQLHEFKVVDNEQKGIPQALLKRIKPDVKNDSLLVTYSIADADGLIKIKVVESAEYVLSSLGYYNRQLNGAELLKLKRVTLPLDTLHSYVVDEYHYTESAIGGESYEIDANMIFKEQGANMSDLLENAKTGIFMQRSQQGGGSPVLRGNEANRVLLMVDDIRMNHAIFRSGHLQNIMSIDPLSLSKVEVAYGANSVYYGSDVIGGVIDFKVQDPVLDTFSMKVNTSYFYANKAKNYHLSFNYGKEKWANYTSVTRSVSGDLLSGHNKNMLGDYRWLQHYKVSAHYLGQDSVIGKPNRYLQEETGYKQWDVIHKWTYQSNKKNMHMINMQWSRSSEVNRYDRLTQNNSGEFMGITGGDAKYAEWYYGPASRALFAYEWKRTDADAKWQYMQLIPSFQYYQESRHTRRFKSLNRTNREERVKVLGLRWDASRFIKNWEWQVGGSSYADFVTSKAFTYNLIDKTVSPASTRYPDGGSRVWNSGLYTSAHYQKGNWGFSTGLRYQYNMLQANFDDNSFFDFPFSQLSLSHHSVTAFISSKWKKEQHAISFMASNGFRSPNVDDIGKVFDSQAGERVILPGEDFKAEQAFNIELGYEWKSKKLEFATRAYHNYMVNMLQLAPGQYQGQDSILFEGSMAAVYTQQNIGRAHIYGATAHLKWQFIENWSTAYMFVYTKGRDLQSSQPLSHIPPTFMSWSLSYDIPKKDAVLRFFVNANGVKKASEYGDIGVDKWSLAIPNEDLPAWFTLNFDLNVQEGEHVQVVVGIQNLLDTHYRSFASGISAPGRNYFGRLLYTF